MKKSKIAKCPFCGEVPSGKRFCSTEHGPMLECEGCGANGPPALGGETYVGTSEVERRLEKKAIHKWNWRAAS